MRKIVTDDAADTGTETDPLRLWALLCICAAILLAVTPFTVLRAYYGDYHGVATNLILAAGVLLLGGYAWYQRRIESAAMVLALFYTAMGVLLVHQRDVTLLFWLFPVALGNLLILARPAALVLNGTALLAVLPAHAQLGALGFAAFVVSFLSLNAVAYLVSYMAQLRHEEVIRSRAELAEKSSALAERVKELTCLHRVGELAQQGHTIAEAVLMQRIAALLPSGMAFPERAGARIELEGREFRTEGFQSAPDMLTAPVWLDGRAAGTVSISYGSGPDATAPPLFLEEERALVTMVAAQIAQLVERRHAHERLTRLVYEDALTGLPTRIAFIERVDRMIGDGLDASAAVLVMINLRRFNDINQVYGYAAGDQLLVAVGERVRSLAQQSGAVARVGGNQFAFVCTPDETFAADYAGVAASVNAELANPFTLGPGRVQLDTTLGIAPLASDCRNADEAMRRAQLALSVARESDGSRWAVYEAAMDRMVRQRTLTTERLRVAIGNGELELHYQPKVRLADGVVASAEALLRWRDPTRGLLQPGAFIGLAERSQLIVPMGAWVIGEACAMLRTLREAGQGHITVSVNLSLVQFLRSNVIDTVRRALEDSNVPPSALMLEITESVFAGKSRALLSQILALRSMGVRLSLDDFGTGYSSLAQINEYPFDEIKLDRQFVYKSTHQLHSRRIVQLVLRVARATGAVVVAEGLETEEEVRLMRKLGCQQGQGFYFAQGLHDIDFRALLASGASLPLIRNEGAAAAQQR